MTYPCCPALHRSSAVGTLTLAALALMVTAAGAQSPMRVAPSGRATTEVVFTPAAAAGAPATAATPVRLRIDYGQPHLRGRQLNTEKLVPYGKAWRLGANDATLLVSDVDLVIGGKDLPKGRYLLQAMPETAGWTLLIQRETGQTPMAAAMSYDAANDVARVDLRLQTLTTPLESFTVWLIPATGDGPAHGELRMAWGGVQLSTDWTTK